MGMWIRDLLVSMVLELDRTARMDTRKVSTCRGSFGVFETTCFQLDREASFETTGMFYFSCNRSSDFDLSFCASAISIFVRG